MNVRVCAVGMVVAGALGLGSVPLDAQQHLTVPALANATHPSDLDFQAGECDVEPTGRMACQFQQVFLTPAAFDADTCLITTNRYALTLEKQAGQQWASTDGPSDTCGVIVTTTLQNDGGAMWSMDTRTTVTKKDSSPDCQRLAETTESLSWRNTRRALPCRFVQPGAMSR
jgi:hypothetical protein